MLVSNSPGSGVPDKASCNPAGHCRAFPGGAWKPGDES